MLPSTYGGQAVSVKQVYSIAVVARSKLGTAANEAEHNLRVLVGHANLLDDLTEVLLNSPTETSDSGVDRWSHALIDIDDDSDGSSCDDDTDIMEIHEEDHLSNPEISTETDQCSGTNHSEIMTIRPGPKQSTPILQILEAMPTLERMKHCPTLERIEEEDAYCFVQAMEAIPVAVQAMQALTASERADDVFERGATCTDSAAVDVSEITAVVRVT